MNKQHLNLWAKRLICGAFAASLLSAAGCRNSAPADLISQEDTTEALVFVKAEGEETLNRTRADGNLFILSPISPDGVVTNLTNFTGATVCDPAVSFDGEKILFSMRPQGSNTHNIYEINADGSGLRQVTANGGNDFDPLYLPNGQIIFGSKTSLRLACLIQTSR